MSRAAPAPLIHLAGAAEDVYAQLGQDGIWRSWAERIACMPDLGDAAAKIGQVLVRRPGG